MSSPKKPTVRVLLAAAKRYPDHTPAANVRPDRTVSVEFLGSLGRLTPDEADRFAAKLAAAAAAGRELGDATPFIPG